MEEKLWETQWQISKTLTEEWDITKKGNILLAIPSLGFSHQFWKHFCLAGHCELRKSASKQCGIHFLRKFPRSWIWLPLMQTHHQILSAHWEQTCLGLTPTKLVWSIYLQWEQSQELECSKFIWPILTRLESLLILLMVLRVAWT